MEGARRVVQKDFMQEDEFDDERLDLEKVDCISAGDFEDELTD
jgi:hypothetical protein